MEEMITITLKRFKELQESELEINALIAAGVDNWDGYSYAQELLADMRSSDAE